MKKLLLVIVVLGIVAVVAVSCASLNRRQGGQWTPPPVTGRLAIGTQAPALVPLATAAPGSGEALATPVLPTAILPTSIPTRVVPTPTVAAAEVEPARDPDLVIITEADVLRAVTSGAAAEQGATLENGGVRFTDDGRMILTAGQVGYGFVNAQNVTLVGRLVAVDGKLQLQTESITPGGLVTALIPTIANQALQQYTSKWYIEDVRTTEGQIELHVRP